MIDLLNIALDFGEKEIPVGRLLLMQKRIHFEYFNSFLAANYNISPLRIPRKMGVQTFDPILFEGLPGVFNDSLPDGWGRLLFDRAMRLHGVNPSAISPLDRLAHVGKHGIGALVYYPEIEPKISTNLSFDLDNIALEASAVLKQNDTVNLDELMALNGSSSGARPKALVSLNSTKTKIIHRADNLTQVFEPWIVKFANTLDGPDIGAVEYAYSQMAKLAGLNMPETHFFDSKICAGYFATKRFDRNGVQRLHTHTACGVLHSDFRTPTLDYSDLLLLTLELTKDMRQVEAMYRLAVFNVCAHNRDDHSKNFTYLMDSSGTWSVSPAYDLTFSFGPGGEQSTTVLGEGRSPSLEHLKKLAANNKIAPATANNIISQCLAALQQWPVLGKNAGVSSATLKTIKSHLLC